MPEEKRQKTAAEYIADAQLLKISGNLEGALGVLNEGVSIYFESRELLFERAKVHVALGNWHRAHLDDVQAMNILYFTRSQVTDDQRILKTSQFERYDKQHKSA